MRVLDRLKGESRKGSLEEKNGAQKGNQLELPERLHSDAMFQEFLANIPKGVTVGPVTSVKHGPNGPKIEVYDPKTKQTREGTREEILQAKREKERTDIEDELRNESSRQYEKERRMSQQLDEFNRKMEVVIFPQLHNISTSGDNSKSGDTKINNDGDQKSRDFVQLQFKLPLTIR